MTQDLETLLERARAAELQAKRLEESISASLRRLIELVVARRMLHFTPADQTISYPQDFPEMRRIYQPFPIQSDDVPPA
jgi:hypothetical protein